jgi:hypothetical protein
MTILKRQSATAKRWERCYGMDVKGIFSEMVTGEVYFFLLGYFWGTFFPSWLHLL